MASGPVLEAVDAALAEHFGQQPQRASVSFVGVEPIEVLRFEPIPGERAYLTCGMSRHPMTAADEFVVSDDGPRAELMIHLHDPTDAHAEVWRRLALLGASPAVEGVVYRAGMTIDTGEPLVAGAAVTGGVVVESSLEEIPTPSGPVRILQILPATSNELAWGRVRGADALLERLRSGDVDLLDPLRRSVDLT